MRLHKDTKIELLKAVPLFAGCSKAELQRIASLADELDLGDGATLIREGSAAGSSSWSSTARWS